MPTFVIGSGGMVGSSILNSNSEFKILPVTVPWNDKLPAMRVLEQFCDGISRKDEVRIVWAAGAATVGATSNSLSNEVEVFQHFVGCLVATNCKVLSFTLISSAGGIYSGNRETLIDEDTKENPTSNYGITKYHQEQLLVNIGSANKFKVIIARLSNVYGPDQNMAKRQGLISNLVRATFSREPLSIFVPIDTRRDYIHSHDVGIKIGKLIERAEATNGELFVKIICAGKTHTISQIIGEIKSVSKRKPPIIFSLSPLSSQQPLSLSFKSKVFKEIDYLNQVLLPVGIKEICDRAAGLSTTQKI